MQVPILLGGVQASMEFWAVGAPSQSLPSQKCLPFHHSVWNDAVGVTAVLQITLCKESTAERGQHLLKFLGCVWLGRGSSVAL